MPFESEKQRKWMYANEPEMAKEWEKKADPFNPPKPPEDIIRRRPKHPLEEKLEKWWNTIKQAGPVTTTAPGVEPGLINNKVVAPKEEEEEYPIIPKEEDFWRD